MVIAFNQGQGQTSLNQTRGSSIVPADTYARPGVQDTGGDGLIQLGNALSGLGGQFAGLASDANAKREQEQIRNVDYYASQIRKDIEAGNPFQAQNDPRLAALSPTVRGRVAEAIGGDQGHIDGLAIFEQILMDEQLRLDPGASHRAFQEARREAEDRIQGDPAYGSGYIKAFDNVMDKAFQQSQSERAALYQQRQRDGYLRDAIQRSDDATNNMDNPVHGPETLDTFLDSYLNSTMMAESGGNPDAKNTESSASGLFQFIDSTWVETVRKHGPPELRGASREEILRVKNDPDLQRAMARAFTKDNANILMNQGLPVDKLNLHLMHFSGSGAGPNVIRASDDTPLNQVYDAGQYSANRGLFERIGGTVGDLKEYFGKKMDQEYTPSKVAQASIRANDTDWKNSSSLGEYVRQKTVVEGLTNMAVQSMDASYLDRIPPEFIQPEMQGGVQAARGKIDDYNWQQLTRQNTLEKRQRQEQLRADQTAINERWANGEPVDPREYASSSPEAFRHAMQIQAQEPFINEAESLANRNQISRALDSAFIRNDFSDLGITSDGTAPDRGQIESFILEQPNISAKDKVAMINDLERQTNVAMQVGGPEAEQHFNRYLKSHIDNAEQTLGAKYSNINWEAQSRAVWEQSLQDGFNAYSEDNGGQMPIGQAKRDVFDRARQDVRTHLDELIKVINMGGTPEEQQKEFNRISRDPIAEEQDLGEVVIDGVSYREVRNGNTFDLIPIEQEAEEEVNVEPNANNISTLEYVPDTDLQPSVDGPSSEANEETSQVEPVTRGPNNPWETVTPSTLEAENIEQEVAPTSAANSDPVDAQEVMQEMGVELIDPESMVERSEWDGRPDRTFSDDVGAAWRWLESTFPVLGEIAGNRTAMEQSNYLLVRDYLRYDPQYLALLEEHENADQFDKPQAQMSLRAYEQDFAKRYQAATNAVRERKNRN